MKVVFPRVLCLLQNLLNSEKTWSEKGKVKIPERQTLLLLHEILDFDTKHESTLSVTTFILKDISNKDKTLVTYFRTMLLKCFNMTLFQKS